jgi:hypothetical protein
MLHAVLGALQRALCRTDAGPHRPHSNGQAQALYEPPAWSALPGVPLSLEVLRDGCILSKIPIDKLPFYTIGRADTCQSFVSRLLPVDLGYLLRVCMRVGDTDHACGVSIAARGA